MLTGMRSNDVQMLADAIQRDHPVVSPGVDFIWTAAPPVQVIDCVMSLNRKYDSFVLPRVLKFVERFPDVCACADLRQLIDSYATPAAFLKDALNYRFPACAERISGVLTYLIAAQDQFSGPTEAEILYQWTKSVRPRDYTSVGVKGFGLAGFQYLRMLFGAETTKPDVHIKNFVFDVIGRKVSDEATLQLLEEAAAIAEAPLRWLDVAIWESRAR